MSEDEFRPREDDHLIEPMFAGLGAKKVEPERKEGVLIRFLRRLRRSLRPPATKRDR